MTWYFENNDQKKVHTHKNEISSWEKGTSNGERKIEPCRASCLQKMINLARLSKNDKLTIFKAIEFKTDLLSNIVETEKSKILVHILHISHVVIPLVHSKCPHRIVIVFLAVKLMLRS